MIKKYDGKILAMHVSGMLTFTIFIIGLVFKLISIC